MRAGITRHTVTYGLQDGADVTAIDVQMKGFGAVCTVLSRRPGQRPVELGLLELSVPGRHNLLNALAAVAAAEQVGVGFEQSAAALREFRGAERRVQRHDEVKGVLVVDDYGHHPTEIAAVLSAARATLDRRLVVVFQPHRYSRTQQLMQAFGPSLREADEIVLTDIYAAGEDPIAGVTVDALADVVRQGSGRPVRLVRRLDQVVSELLTFVRAGDAVITLGAGSVGSLPRELVAALGQRGTRA